MRPASPARCHCVCRSCIAASRPHGRSQPHEAVAQWSAGLTRRWRSGRPASQAQLRWKCVGVSRTGRAVGASAARPRGRRQVQRPPRRRHPPPACTTWPVRRQRLEDVALSVKQRVKCARSLARDAGAAAVAATERRPLAHARAHSCMRAPAGQHAPSASRRWGWHSVSPPLRRGRQRKRGGGECARRSRRRRSPPPLTHPSPPWRATAPRLLRARHGRRRQGRRAVCGQDQGGRHRAGGCDGVRSGRRATAL